MEWVRNIYLSISGAWDISYEGENPPTGDRVTGRAALAHIPIGRVAVEETLLGEAPTGLGATADIADVLPDTSLQGVNTTLFGIGQAASTPYVRRRDPAPDVFRLISIDETDISVDVSNSASLIPKGSDTPNKTPDSPDDGTLDPTGSGVSEPSDLPLDPSILADIMKADLLTGAKKIRGLKQDLVTLEARKANVALQVEEEDKRLAAIKAGITKSTAEVNTIQTRRSEVKVALEEDLRAGEDIVSQINAAQGRLATLLSNTDAIEHYRKVLQEAMVGTDQTATNAPVATSEMEQPTVNQLHRELRSLYRF